MAPKPLYEGEPVTVPMLAQVMAVTSVMGMYAVFVELV